MSLAQCLMAGKVSSLTSYFSLAYMLVFLPASCILYSLMPKAAKKYFLLAASLIFFWLISGKLVVYLLFAVLIIHYAGLWLDRIAKERDEAVAATEKTERKAVKKAYKNRQRFVVAFAAVLLFGMLLTLKYSAFFTTNINTLLSLCHIDLQFEIPNYLMPIGISFYTMQAMSYVFDVYRGTVKADTNIFRLALFMSFFPQIVEGPICRYGETAEKLWNVESIKYKNLCFGLQRLLFGLMKKMVVADRLNSIVQTVFSYHDNFSGGYVAVAAVCYTVQLYMDFSGTMDAVIGTAEIFGVTMPENFKRPFFSRTISEFWKRWHITLGAWLKDYIFYPVSMSKPMKNLTSSARKKLGNHFGPLLAGSVALFCVWLFNGLWHGSAWNYIFFGMYHFVLILTGNIIEPLVRTVNTKLHINPESKPYKAMQIMRTCVLVCVGEMFFRATGLRAGLSMFKKMFTDFTFNVKENDSFARFSFDVHDVIIVVAVLLIILGVSIANEKGICVRQKLAQTKPVVRWAVLYGLIMMIIIFGAYGIGYVTVDPIYANF